MSAEKNKKNRKNREEQQEEGQEQQEEQEQDEQQEGQADQADQEGQAGQAGWARQEETRVRKIAKHDETRRLRVVLQSDVKLSGVQGGIQRLKGGGEERGGRGWRWSGSFRVFIGVVSRAISHFFQAIAMLHTRSMSALLPLW